LVTIEEILVTIGNYETLEIDVYKYWDYNGIIHLPTGAGFLPSTLFSKGHNMWLTSCSHFLRYAEEQVLQELQGKIATENP
jgi:hypothetical protein